MKSSIVIMLLVIISGCASNNYHSLYYKKNIDISQVPMPEKLPAGQDPQIFSTKNFDRDYSVLLSRGYILLGYSSFQGKMDPRYNVIQVGRDTGATIIITSNAFLGRDSSTVPLLLPTSSTTYSSGSFSGTNNSSFSGTYNESQTTNSSQWIPITVTKNIFKQTTAFFVKTSKTFKLGVYYRDLTPKERQKNERNMGVIITTVIEGTPAFSANIIPEDIVIEVNGQKVNNFSRMSQIINTKGDITDISILRNGKKIDILFHQESSRGISSVK